MKTVAIVQARMGSSRLPGKVLKKLGEKSVMEILLARLSLAKNVDEIHVATSENPENEPLCQEVERLGHAFYRGSETDVLDRFYKAAVAAKADLVVRITGDCPLIQAEVVDAVIDRHLTSGAEYTSNVATPTFPDGLDVEVFSMEMLSLAQNEATSPFEREHVTPYLRSEKFTGESYENATDQSDIRLTLDEPQDLALLERIFAKFAPDIFFDYQLAVDALLRDADLQSLNQHIARNEGATMTNGQKLWNRAKKVIPGGNMLLSKRSEMHLPDNWPSYFTKTQGCSVWDMDNTQYKDVYLMGVGTNILGYSHPAVDAVVMDVVKSGNMSTLNAPEEVLLAEKLVEINPWASMVRFARSGGEANSIAIRIARAASGRDGVAVCGYHGWHDWYLSANLGEDDKLAGHLLPGLSTNGVPKALRGNVHPFNYNDFAHLEELVKTKSIGVIKMEVYRNIEPVDSFLERVRKLASDNGVVLVFDECTSGFREGFGGLHKEYGVEPDIAVYGKTLGNGYAVSAVVGRESIMQSAQSTFISSTFWTERIGSAAGLKTLEVMVEEKPWEHAKSMGFYMQDIWKNLAASHDLDISISGLTAISGFSIKSDQALGYKTLITQQALKAGYLAGTAFYSCKAHTTDILDAYAPVLDETFKLINDCENGRDLNTLLDGPICHSGFKRLN